MAQSLILFMICEDLDDKIKKLKKNDNIFIYLIGWRMDKKTFILDDYLNQYQSLNLIQSVCVCSFLSLSRLCGL